MIEAKNLYKAYDKEVIFKDLAFYANKGEFVVIQGKSGSGKTTLLNMLSTIDAINKGGSLSIDGVSIDKLNAHKRAKFRAKHIGFIFQSYALIPEFSIVENCTIALSVHNIAKQEAQKKAKEIIKEFIDDADENFFHKLPSQLSGGQQQRVAIARALIHDPQIIIADEPTANLDEQSAKDVKEWLQKIAKEQNRCVVVVTHEKDYLHYADRLYRFEEDPTKTAKSVLREVECFKN